MEKKKKKKKKKKKTDKEEKQIAKTSSLPFKVDWWFKFKEQLVTLLGKEAPKVWFSFVCSLESVCLVGFDHGLHTGFRVVVREEQLDLSKLLVLL